MREFYDQDARRRSSEEVEFGNEWRDGRSTRALSWIVDTGELYTMAENEGPLALLLRFGDAPTGGWPASGPTGSAQLNIEVLAVVPTRAGVDTLLDGWQEQMGRPNSLDWLRQRLSQ